MVQHSSDPAPRDDVVVRRTRWISQIGGDGTVCWIRLRSVPQTLVCFGENADERLGRERLQYYWCWDTLRQYSSVSLGTGLAPLAGCGVHGPAHPRATGSPPNNLQCFGLLWEDGSGLAPHWGYGQSLQTLELEWGASGTPRCQKGDGERWRGGRLTL